MKLSNASAIILLLIPMEFLTPVLQDMFILPRALTDTAIAVYSPAANAILETRGVDLAVVWLIVARQAEGLIVGKI